MKHLNYEDLPYDQLRRMAHDKGISLFLPNGKRKYISQIIREIRTVDKQIFTDSITHFITI